MTASVIFPPSSRLQDREEERRRGRKMRSGVREREESKLVGTRTRASRASFTNQSALIGSTSCQGYIDFSAFSFVFTLPLESLPPFQPPNSLTLRQFLLSFCCLFDPSPSFLSVIWTGDGSTCAGIQRICIGVSAHLYQMLQRPPPPLLSHSFSGCEL